MPYVQEAAAAAFQEEFEEDEAAIAVKQQATVNAQLLVGSSGVAPEAGGLQLRVRPQGKAGGGQSSAASSGGAVNAVAAAAAAALIKEFSSSAGAGRAEGVHGRAAAAGGPHEAAPTRPSASSTEVAVSVQPSAGALTGYKKRAADLRADLAAEARVAADLALLSAASDRGGTAEDEMDCGAGVEVGGCGDGLGPVWAPPADQQGDGRTAANDKFGY